MATTIAAENQKPLRKSLTVMAGIDETSAAPFMVEATNTYNDGLYDINACVYEVLPQVKVMDLCNGGFRNDGTYYPATQYALEVEGEQSGKYGYIASYPADADGIMALAVDITVTASREWDYITFLLSDSRGNISTRMVANPTWTPSGFRYQYTETFDSFTPNERLYVLRAALGKSWTFTNDTLVSCTLSLRGVETRPDNPELQMSEIEIQAYEPDNYTDVIGRVTKGAPIWYQSGYAGDMSPMRYFYLNDNMEYKDKVLTIRGYDASYLLDDDFAGQYKASTQGNIKYDFVDMLADLIRDSNVDLPAVDDMPDTDSASTAANLFLDNRTKRQIIANAVNMYRQDGFCINYVDAGVPRLTGKTPISTTWQISDDECADFQTNIELNINEVSGVLQTATIGSTSEEIWNQDIENGQEYWIDTTDPMYSITATGGTATLITPYTIKFKATRTGTGSITGRKIILSAAASDNPYTLTNTEGGTAIELDDQMLIPTADGDMAKIGMQDLLDRSNIYYEFTYRGNPHWMPRDLIEYTFIDGTTETMTIESFTLEHQGYGLTSHVVARKGVV